MGKTATPALYAIIAVAVQLGMLAHGKGNEVQPLSDQVKMKLVPKKLLSEIRNRLTQPTGIQVYPSTNCDPTAFPLLPQDAHGRRCLREGLN